MRSHYEDGVRESDPQWAWWVDERELAWHEGMALIDLGRPGEAVDKFHQSVWGKTAQQMRGRYLHLGYLLVAQVTVGAWIDAETTMREIATMVSDVSSTRTVVLLTAILPQLQRDNVPSSTRETGEQLALLLSHGYLSYYQGVLCPSMTSEVFRPILSLTNTFSATPSSLPWLSKQQQSNRLTTWLRWERALGQWLNTYQAVNA
jgi:hypothetical protein